MSSVIGAGLNVAPMQPMNLGQLLNSYGMSNAQLQGAQLANQGKQLSNQTAATNLQTLGQMNQAKLDQLNILTQKQQAQVPYFGQNAASQAKLLQQQANLYPVSTVGALLGNLGRLGYNVQPGAAYRNLPKPLADALAANNVAGVPNVGAIRNPNMGMGNTIGEILNQYLPGSGLGNALSNPQASSQMPSNPLPLPQNMLDKIANQTAQLNQPQTLSPASIQSGVANGLGSPSQAQDVINQLNTSGQNSVASANKFTLLGRATNALVTMDKIKDQFGDPAVTFAPLMGISGSVEKNVNKVLPQGTKDPVYQKYLAFKSLVPLQAAQITQYLGGSITPQAQEELHYLMDPVHWDTTPKVAMMKLNALNEMLHQEAYTWADQTGQGDKFRQRFPAFDPVAFHQEMVSNPKYAKDLYQSLPMSRRAQVKALAMQGGQHGTNSP